MRNVTPHACLLHKIYELAGCMWAGASQLVAAACWSCNNSVQQTAASFRCPDQGLQLLVCLFPRLYPRCSLWLWPAGLVLIQQQTSVDSGWMCIGWVLDATLCICCSYRMCCYTVLMQQQLQLQCQQHEHANSMSSCVQPLRQVVVLV